VGTCKALKDLEELEYDQLVGELKDD